jgi:DNA polymerase-3 subunit gamma/tau
MSSQTLYRKYRSSSLDDIIGQEHVTKTLDAAITQNKVSHAYLFTGPRGTGKTSIARIFAHRVNDLPYQQEKNHLDIIEIDAASNRSIDNIRDLKEKLNSAPTSSKYKVYIIDEVHMLTTESFNALLKTLEEPPAHIIFILATTDYHKIPATILSRVQKFFFKPIEQAQITAHLTSISQQESFKFTDSALSLIAQYAHGSMRDALSLLDQVASLSQNITEDLVLSALGMTSSKDLQKLCGLILSPDPNAVEISKIINQILSSGSSASSVGAQVFGELKLKLTKLSQLEILSELLTLGASTQPNLNLELTILKLSLSLSTNTDSTPPASPKGGIDNDQNSTPLAREGVSQPPAPKTEPPKEASSKESAQPAKILKSKKPKITKEATTDSSKDTPKATEADQPNLTKETFVQEWPSLIIKIGAKSPSIRAIIKSASPKLDQDQNILSLTTAYPLHKKILEDLKNQKIIAEVIASAGFSSPKLNIQLNKAAKSKKSSPAEQLSEAPKLEDSLQSYSNQVEPQQETPISDIIKLMGGGDLVQI